jgi:pimeloyl-ACP methyl ester carboxylesterase
MMATTTEATTHSLDVPGATLTYDVRLNDASMEPSLLIIGSPMGASGFQTLASHFPDRTVVTYDPRGVERSIKDDPATESTPVEHADDLHRLIGALGGGPVDLFASSGGAVNALALVERHPEDVRTLVAHEPPAARVVPDADAALAANRDIAETYRRAGFGRAMAKFVTLVGFRGPIPAGFFSGIDPDPAMFGLPRQDDGSRTDPLFSQNLVTCTGYPVGVEALRAASTRIVIGVGEESEGQLARRGGEAVAERLGIKPVVFPGGHGGFLGDEYGPGQAGKPDEFAAKLREVLASAAIATATGEG